MTIRKPINRISAIFLALHACLTAQPDGGSGLKAPSTGLQEVDYRDVTFQGGFWGVRQEIHKRTTVTHVLDKLEEKKHITNFDMAAEVLELRNQSQNQTHTGFWNHSRVIAV